MNQSTTSILIVSSSTKKRHQKAQELSPISLNPNNPDVFLYASDQVLGIDIIKDLRHSLQKKPYQEDIKVAFIQNAHLLTIPAQNALLKTLEEPPDSTLIILGAINTSQLLPTIVSRCHTISAAAKRPQINTEKSREVAQLLDQVTKSDPAQRITLAQNYTKSRQIATNLCRSLLLYLRHQLRHSPSSNAITNLQITQKTLVRLDQNVNVSLTLEHLFLHLF